MFIFFNPNPAKKAVGDCSVRALCKALSVTWDEAFAMIATKAFELCDMPSSNAVWGDVLRDHGFVKKTIDDCTDCVDLKTFCKVKNRGLYVVALPMHVVCVENGNYFDAWDSGNESHVLYYFEKEKRSDP